VRIWKRALGGWSGWPWHRSAAASPEQRGEDSALGRARDSLRALIEDRKLPLAVRDGLSEELGHIQAMLERLEQGHIHIALFGRVGVGKSALVNALLGEQRFSTSPLHGETRAPQAARWDEWDAGGVFLIDTPGIDDIEGEAREHLAREVSRRADLVLFVVDGDASATEIQALRLLNAEHKPLVLVLNKADRYTQTERGLLQEALTLRCRGLVKPDRIVCSAARPGPRAYLSVDREGLETEVLRPAEADVRALRELLWTVLESEGKALAALNATLFAGDVSDTISARVLAIKRDLATALIRSYCLIKGVVVGLNPIPISDLVAAGAADIGLVLHLARIYGFPMGTAEAGRLIATIAAQMALVMGTVWAVHFVSSAIKGGTAGLSTLVTGATQGAVAYYSALVVGRAAQRYLAEGRSWGPLGPKRVVQEILDGLDRDSLLTEARDRIAARLHRPAGP
jgi:small GTP-binding protein